MSALLGFLVGIVVGINIGIGSGNIGFGVGTAIFSGWVVYLLAEISSKMEKE